MVAAVTIMAFKPPDNFNFSTQEQWPAWRQRFLRYRTASELSKKTVDVQTSVLIDSMCPTAEEIFNMFDVEEEETTFDEIIDLFNGYFTPKVNVIHERAIFHQRSQLAGENIETYVRSLYEHAEHADFRDKESTIRDRLVVGLRDRELSEKLQLQPDLTLKTAIDVARQHEQVKVQMSEQQTPVVNVVKSRTSQDRKYFPKGCSEATLSQSTSKMWQMWQRLTKKTELNVQQKERFVTAVEKRNHFAAYCRGKRQKLSAVENFPSRENSKSGETGSPVTYFLGSAEENKKPWITSFVINGQKCQFKIDTGAYVSIISLSQYNKLVPKPTLNRTRAVLKSPAGVMECHGQFVTHIRRENDCQYALRLFVVDADTENFLGRSEASDLNLVKREQNINDVNSTPSVFGDLDDKPLQCKPVKIKLKEGADPYSLYTARRVPIPLMDKVKAEIERMKANNITEEITEATDWCAGMVPVMKRNGEVRICTDFK